MGWENNLLGGLQNSVRDLDSICNITTVSPSVKEPERLPDFFQNDVILSFLIYLGAANEWFALSDGTEKYSHAEHQEEIILRSGVIEYLKEKLDSHMPVIMGGGDARSERRILEAYIGKFKALDTVLVDIAPDILARTVKELDDHITKGDNDLRLNLDVKVMPYEELPSVMPEIRRIDPKKYGNLVFINFGNINEQVDRITPYDSKAQALIGQISRVGDLVVRTEHVVDVTNSASIKRLEESYRTSEWMDLISKNAKRFAGIEREDIHVHFNYDRSAIEFYADSGGKRKVLYISEKKTKERLFQDYRRAGLQIDFYYEDIESGAAVIVSKPMNRFIKSELIGRVKFDIIQCINNDSSDGKDYNNAIIYNNLSETRFRGVIDDLIKRYRSRLDEDSVSLEQLTSGDYMWQLSDNEKILEFLWGLKSILRTGDQQFALHPDLSKVGYNPYEEILKSFLKKEESEKRVKAKILYVEDDPHVSHPLKEYCEARLGIEVQVVSSVFEAKERLDNERFDTVLTDLNLGDESGINILDYMRVKDPAVPVIVLTGYSTRESAIAAMRRGAYEYLQKPIAYGILQGKLLDAINFYRSQSISRNN